jgi:hypothetical protein
MKFINVTDNSNHILNFHFRHKLYLLFLELRITVTENSISATEVAAVPAM